MEEQLELETLQKLSNNKLNSYLITVFLCYTIYGDIIMFNNDLDKMFLIVTVTFLFTALIMPLTNKIAEFIGAVDIPRDNRRVHTTNIPKLGGLGIFFGFLFGYMLFGEQSIQMNSILIGSFIIILYGIVDDIKSLDSKYQILGQLLAASTIVFYGNILLSDINIFNTYIDFGYFAYPITLIFILGCINVIRLIDGIDGLSSGISSIFFLTIGIISFLMGKVNSLEIILSFIMLGAASGFLIHNFHPAKLFAGECGSAFMGFIIAVISLLGYKGALVTSVLVPIFLLFLPILDTLLAIIRRKIKGKKISDGDKDHLHHQMLRMNLSQRRTVLVIYAINILFSILAILYALEESTKGIIIYIILILIAVWFILHTSIISENIEEKVKSYEKKIFKK